MSLINELQECAERDDAATVLRKAKRVCAKLGRKDILQWINHELNGYDGVKDVPSYREALTTLCYKSNGYIPAGYGRIKSGVGEIPGWSHPFPYTIRDSISSIQDQIRAIDSGLGLYLPLPKEAESTIKSRLVTNLPWIMDQISLLIRISDSVVRDIPEQVKNAVLDWACELEAAGVEGNNHSFSKGEQSQAKAVVFNINNCQISQLSDSGNNYKGIANG